MTRRTARYRILMVAAVIGMMVAAACGSSDPEQTSSDSAALDRDDSGAGEGAAPTTVPGATPAGGDAAGDDTTEEVELPVGQVPADRRIIRTANVLTEVRDVDDAAASVRAAALASDGYLFSQELAEEYGTVVVKVPADRFEDAIETMVGIGNVRRQSTSAEDVTARYADLEGRLEALQTSIDRLLGFLGEATDVGEIASIEGELTRREAERDSIAGQLQVLENQTAFSTITVELALPDNLPADPDDDRDGFLGGLDDGLAVIGAVGSGLATIAGFLVPFLPAFAIVGGPGGGCGVAGEAGTQR